MNWKEEVQRKFLEFKDKELVSNCFYCQHVLYSHYNKGFIDKPVKPDSTCISFHFFVVKYQEIDIILFVLSVGIASTAESTGRSPHEGEATRREVAGDGAGTAEKGAGSE